MEIRDLLELYHSHKANCCNCGCQIESGFALGSVFVLDYDGNFYCMGCDDIFGDCDERIFEAEFYENDEAKTALNFLDWLRDMGYYNSDDIETDVEEMIEDFEILETQIPRLFNLLRNLSDR